MSNHICKFIHETHWENLPAGVRKQARRCLVDTLAAAIGGRQTDLSGIIHDFAFANHAGSGAHLWLDGRELSPPGAGLANGMTIDALDIHDGYNLVKGHAGAAVIPAALATIRLGPNGSISGKEFLTSLIVGYEVALRAGRALHATACDYHTSGAWNSLGCAALTARRIGLKADKTRHALGIAEYHGPRSPMMRCIDHPTMVKDGSGWGSMVGISAALLAQAGFTGAPAEIAESTELEALWSDLGVRWLILEQYFKPYAICRWAQPAVVGALAIQQKYKLSPGSIRRIRVTTFHEASRLATTHPLATEQAQYSLPFSVAAALVFGRLGPQELTGSALENTAVLRLAEKVELIEDPAFTDRFPEERYSRVRVETMQGRQYDSGDVQPDWGDKDPPSDEELLDKFRWLAATMLPPERVGRIERAAWGCQDLTEAEDIVGLLAPPVHEIM